MKTATLLAALEEAAKKTNEHWMASLSERKTAELEFHDRDRDEVITASLTAEEYAKTHGNKKYYSTTQWSRNYVEKWIRDHAPGRVVLDYACGNGEFTLEAARAGADLVIGVDISRVSIENCRRKTAALNLTGNSFFLQGDCENTGLPDNSVDLVICSGMLHHLDLSYAFPELRRIMKPGGMCLCYEALKYNPAIRLYRKLTPKMRTQWEKEHILSLADVAFARRFFHLKEIRYWHLLSPATAPLRNTAVFPHTLAVANALDSLILKLPLISLMAWIFTFVLVKREDR